MDDSQVRADLLSIREHVDAIEVILQRLLDEPPPANVVELRKPDEVELEGIIGRPQLREVKGRQLFTAGLKLTEGNVTRWVDLVGWGEVATSADYLMRGDKVRVVGAFRENRYLDSQGVMQVKQQFVCSLISAIASATSGFTPSRATANGTT